MPNSETDRRKHRTRTALFDAFRDLVTEDRKAKITVPDVIERANVGRSTFYEHFKNIDDLHLQSLSHPFAILVKAIIGESDATHLEGLLTHFWENRQRARATLCGVERDKISRLLADLIEPHVSNETSDTYVPPRLVAVQLADAALAPIRGWLMAEAWCETDVLAKMILETSAAILQTVKPNRLQ